MRPERGQGGPGAGVGVRLNHPVHVCPHGRGAVSTCVGWWPEEKDQDQAAISPECELRERGPAAQSTRQCLPGRSSLEESHGTLHLMCRHLIGMRQHCPLLNSSGRCFYATNTCLVFPIYPYASRRFWPPSVISAPSPPTRSRALALVPSAQAVLAGKGHLILWACFQRLLGVTWHQVLLCQASR